MFVVSMSFCSIPRDVIAARTSFMMRELSFSATVLSAF